MSSAFLNAQENDVCSFKVVRNDTSLIMSGEDTSYIFNVYLVTRQLGQITSVEFTRQGLGQDYTWSSLEDTMYVWNDVETNDTLPLEPNVARKLNGNVMVLSLGRLYFSVRQKFIFVLNGTNGILTKEIIF